MLCAFEIGVIGIIPDSLVTLECNGGVPLALTAVEINHFGKQMYHAAHNYRMERYGLTCLQHF